MQHQIVSREEWLTARLGLLNEEKELTRRSDELARRRLELPWVRIDKEYEFDTDLGSARLADLFRGRSQLLLDFNVSFTEKRQREGIVEYNYRRGGHAMDATPAPEPVAQLAATCGTDAPTYSRDRPGMSAFVLDDGVVYHTYSAYARGLDGLWGMYQWLDRAPKGRNETGIWWRRHDEYEARPQNAGHVATRPRHTRETDGNAQAVLLGLDLSKSSGHPASSAVASRT